MKNSKGVAHILVMLLIIVAVVAGALYYFYNSGSGLKSDYLNVNKDKTESMEQDTSDPVMAEPVSDDTSLDTIEAELDATIIGSPETEIDAMGEDASTL